MGTGLSMADEFSFNQSNKLYTRKKPASRVRTELNKLSRQAFCSTLSARLRWDSDILFNALKLVYVSETLPRYHSSCC